MKNNGSYYRIGTRYYKVLIRPTISGDKISTLDLWSKDTIISDHGKDFISEIPKLDGFCCIPDHLNYSQIVDNFYNTYQEIPHLMDKDSNLSMEELKEKIPFTMEFIKHIFGEQSEIGLDYIKILIEHPTQTLPILCLVSKERATGKSTFIKWLKLIFGLNMTYIKGDSFYSQFNADWASKLIVAIDEVFFDKKEITERLKYLSTTNKDKVEAKGRDRQEIDFFAKFILCSNNEDSFIQIDNEEIRFWIRKVKTIKKEDSHFISRLEKEIPVFQTYLIKRKYSTQQQTRMWFSVEQIYTKALAKLRWQQANKLERYIIEILHELFLEIDADKVNVCINDIINISPKRQQNLLVAGEIRKILKKWGFMPENNSKKYVGYSLSSLTGEYVEVERKGRFYTIDRGTINKKNDALMQD